jgi:1-acyl-sn-glycerol-3-phosphate acyltransferase
MSKLRTILAAGWSLLVFGVVAFLAMLTLRLLARQLTKGWPAIWGRSALAIVGVKLRIRGEENLFTSGSKIAIANHTSALDVPIVAALGPRWPLCLAKAELRWFPVFNVLWWSLGQVFMDRRDPKRAKASLAAIAAATTGGERTVVLAPEGTRSVDGELGRFKLGAFRLAVATGAPIVPIVIRGAGQLMPKGQWWVEPGEVVVEVMPPIETVGWVEEDVVGYAAEMEGRYREWLGVEV